MVLHYSLLVEERTWHGDSLLFFDTHPRERSDDEDSQGPATDNLQRLQKLHADTKS